VLALIRPWWIFSNTPPKAPSFGSWGKIRTGFVKHILLYTFGGTSIFKTQYDNDDRRLDVIAKFNKQIQFHPDIMKLNVFGVVTKYILQCMATVRMRRNSFQ